MMRCLVALSILSLATGDYTKQYRDATCMVDSGEAVSDAMDASLFIYAASQRCGKEGMTIKCEVDVTSMIQSVNSMINVVLKAVDKCDGLHTHGKKCGLQAGKLSEHTAALAAAGGMVAQKCAPAAASPPALGPVAPPIMCTVNIKNSVKSLFHLIKALMKSTSECAQTDSRRCAVNIIDVIGSLAGVGEFMAGAVGQCKRTNTPGSVNGRTALCAQASESLVHHTMDVSQAAIVLSKECETETAPMRLFEEEDKDDKNDKKDDASVMNIALGALLPVTAFAAFVGGRRYGLRADTREVMTDPEE